MRVPLIAAGIAAALLLLRAFTTIVPQVPSVVTLVAWALTAALAVAAIGFGKQQKAASCGLAAAMMVLFNPLMPTHIPADWNTPLAAVCGGLLAAVVVRYWE